jgi:predicted transposase/invertase (TIGR01784 family)
VRIDETDELVDICRDNVFKAVFTKNTPVSRGALSALLSSLVGRELTVQAITANEPPVENVRDRQIRFDIACKAETGELANVEMTLYPDTLEPLRLEFHSGKLFSGQDIYGRDKSFSDLQYTYQISFLVHKSFFPDNELVHCFEYFDPIRKIALGGRSRIITAELQKLDTIIDKSVNEMNGQEHWSVFFRYICDKTKREKINGILECEEGIAMASEVLLTISKDEVERARLLSEYKYKTDLQSQRVDARREGLQEGLQKGLQKGRNELLDLLKSGAAPEEIIKRYT